MSSRPLTPTRSGGGQLATPGLSCRRLPVAPKRSEKEVQQVIVDGLTLSRYCVLVTSRHLPRTRCPSCGCWHLPNFSDKASKGVPDLLCRGRGWPVGLWAGLEVKGATTRLSEEQKALQAEGAIIVVRSFDEALAAVQAVEEELRRNDT